MPSQPTTRQQQELADALPEEIVELIEAALIETPNHYNGPLRRELNGFQTEEADDADDFDIEDYLSASP